MAVLISILAGMWIAHGIAPDDPSGKTPGGVTAIVLTCIIEIVLLLVVASGINIIPIGHKGILTVFGERSDKHVLKEGFNFVPVWMGVIQFDVRENKLEIPAFECLTSDHLALKLRMAVQHRVFDLFRYSDVHEGQAALRDLAIQTTGALISSMEAINVAVLKDNLADRVKDRMEATASSWGVRVVAIFVTEMRLPEQVQDFGQLVDVIKRRHPEIPASRVLDAVLTERGRLKSLIVNSNSIESVASSLIERLK